MRDTRIYLNGKRVAFRAECVECHLIAETSPPPDGWEYIEVIPDGEYGWLCRECQMG